MRPDPHRRVDLRGLLAAAASVPPVSAIDVLARELARAVGARDVEFLISDFSGYAVVRLARVGTPGLEQRRHGEETAVTVPLAGTVYGHTVRTQRLQVVEEPDGHRVLTPVTDRGDVIGVVELWLADPPDQSVLDYLADAAHAFGYVVIANRRFTDLFEWGQRSAPLTLAAEIQRRLLPPSLTYEGPLFTIACALEPAGRIGGDTFDYSLDRGTLHVSLTDAMGHEEKAALLATLVVGSLRNSRRVSASMLEQAAAANAAVLDHAGADEYVTGLLVRVDLREAIAHVVNAGHPHPLRVRRGTVELVDLEPDLPFGTFADTPFRLHSVPLQPGDRLVLVTDGLGEAQGLDLSALLRETRSLHPRETVQALTRAAEEAERSVRGELVDDATAVCIDWRGVPEIRI